MYRGKIKQNNNKVNKKLENKREMLVDLFYFYLKVSVYLNIF